MLAGQPTPVTVLNTMFFGIHAKQRNLEVRVYTMAKDRAHAIVAALVTHPWKIEAEFYVVTGLVVPGWKIEADVVHNQALHPMLFHYHPIIHVSLTTQCSLRPSCSSVK